VEVIRLFKLLDRNQRNTFLACFLGWALDAFDFFLLTFVIVPMARDFGTSVADLSYAITITLAMRPVGAFIFGLLGDRFGRRIPLMIDIVFYSLMELLTAFSPNYTWLLIFRALYGIGMGGEWGLGASLAMETLPTADGNSADRCAWIVLGNFAAGIHVWIFIRRADLWSCVPVVRLARIVCSRCAAGVARDLYSGARSRVASLVTTEIESELLGEPRRHPEAALAAVDIRHSVDDSVQRHVTRDPGHVPDLFGRTAWAQRERKIDYWNYLCRRRDLRRDVSRPSFAKVRPSPIDRCHCDMQYHFNSCVGFLAWIVDAGGRRVPNAIHRARRLGNRASAFK